MPEVFVSEMRWAMKTFLTFLMSAIIALTTMAPMAVADDTLMPPAKSYNERIGPLNNYYIGIHRPDGGCATVEVFADNYDEAVKIVKRDRCDFCVLDDLTAYYTSTGADVRAQASRTCPLR